MRSITSVFSLFVFILAVIFSGCFKITIMTYPSGKTPGQEGSTAEPDPVLEKPEPKNEIPVFSGDGDKKSGLEYSSLELKEEAVPLKDGIESIFLVGSLIFVQQKDHSVWAFDADKLTTAWKFNSKFPLEFAPSVNEHSAYLLIHGHLHCISLADGKPRWETLLPFTASCPPVASDNEIFIGDYENNFYCLDVVETSGGEDRSRIKWKNRMDSYAASKPVITRIGSTTHIYVMTYKGNLYKFTSDGKQLEDPSSVLGPVVAPMSHYMHGDDKYLIIPSVIGQLNAYHLKYGFSGPLNDKTAPGGWRFQTKATLKEEVPLLLDKRVYFKADAKQDFTILDLKNGKTLWTDPDIDRALMLANRNSYLLTKDKKVVALNRLSLKLANWTLSFDKYDFVLTSPELPKLFAATKAGEIHSYTERE